MPKKNLPDLIPLQDLAEIEFVSSSVEAINRAIGGFGIPRCGVTEIYGAESSGKSTIALTFLPTVYVDVERSLDVRWAQKFAPSMQVARPLDLGSAFALIESILPSRPRVVVLDSLGAGITEAEMEAVVEDKFRPGSQAQVTSTWLRMLATTGRLDHTALIVVNQLRTTFAQYGSPVTTPGGRLLHHMALMRISASRTEWVEVGDRKVGQGIVLRVTKSKVGVPWSEGVVWLGFDGKFYESKDALKAAARRR